MKRTFIIFIFIMFIISGCNKQAQQIIQPISEVKKEIPQKEVALESSSPNYKTLGAIVCATAAVLYAVYKYYPRRQQEEYHITKPLDYDVMNIWNVPSWHELEPHQQYSYLCLAVKHFFDSGGKARDIPQWYPPPSRIKNLNVY